ncbi:hypothetical protein [Kitasatospora purpeofusca]|uniref:hypothetical protein n=1 Tax=Kitasatospora purpeofusca TaxID=67352 RepID=UPI00364677DB
MLVGRQGVDDFLNQLDVAYYDDHTIAVQVSTHRQLPDHFRTTSPLRPSLLLDSFLVNSSPGGPVVVPDEPAQGIGELIVDGAAVPADRLTRGDYVVTSATVADVTIAVISTIDLHDQAVLLHRESAGPADGPRQDPPARQ